MKALFRYLRGEINGFYLTNIYNSLNVLTEEDRNFLGRFANTVFKSEDEVVGKEYPISNDMLKGIGKVAGIFPLRVTTDSFSGALRMSMSNIVDGVEYSERGLFNMEREDFDFVRTSQEEFNTDINTLATDARRTSMNSPDDTVVGYIPEGVQVLKEDGTIDLSKIVFEPPAEGAYSEFYGVDHLYMSESENVFVNLSNKIYLDLIKALQWIRYNGDSISSLCKVIEVLCPDFLHIESIDWSNKVYGIVNYSVSAEEIDNKQMKIDALKFLVKMKFPQLIMVEEQ